MTNEDAKKAILKLFQCYNQKGDDTDRKIKFEAYWEILSELSPAEIVAVCKKASRGEIGQPGFLPTTGELYQSATKFKHPANRYPILNAPSLDPAELRIGTNGRSTGNEWKSIGQCITDSAKWKENT